MNKQIIHFFTFILLTLLMEACASMGTPNGGPKDITPPQYTTSIPKNGALNFKKKKIEIAFDEMISIEKPSEKIVVSPPQKNMPVIKGAGKKIFVQLKDTLKENTTYTIDFNDAIVDLNEKNPLESFALSFSTGDYIDSLAISGTLINAEDQELVPEMIVGIQPADNDSAFQQKEFLRISKTNSKGEFSIKNIAHGTYRLYALNDLNRDYKFDQPGEAIAFHDSLIVPSFFEDTRLDTTWQDSITIDTIQPVKYNHFIPDNLLLRMFKEDFIRQYLVKSEWVEKKFFTLYMAGKADSLPMINLLNKNVEGDWYEMEHSLQKDTITYWITQKELMDLDTLSLAITFRKTDSLNQLKWNTDTVKLLNKGKKLELQKEEAQKKQAEKQKKKTKKKNNTTPMPEYYTFSENLASTQHLYKPFYIEFAEPLKQMDKKGVHLKIKQDTTWTEVPFSFTQDSIRKRLYWINSTWQPGKEYSFETDSACFENIYGVSSDYYERKFKVKTNDAYSKISIFLENFNEPGFIELLDNKENVIYHLPINQQKAEFQYVDPGNYYIRLIVDTNKNNRWDTGDYEKRIQPEMVYYYPKKIEIKVNWDIEEYWNPLNIPILEQKPETLRQVKRFDKQNDKTKSDEDESNDFNPFRFEEMEEE